MPHEHERHNLKPKIRKFLNNYIFTSSAATPGAFLHILALKNVIFNKKKIEKIMEIIYKQHYHMLRDDKMLFPSLIYKTYIHLTQERTF